MAIGPILDFIAAAVGFLHPDPDAAEQTKDASVLNYHRKVVVTAAVCGGITAAAGIVAVSLADSKEKDIKMLLLLPILFLVIGIVMGVALACLVAPREFLTGPVGEKW